MDLIGGNPETDCETEDVIESYIDGMVQANTKFIGQYFNIDQYAQSDDQKDNDMNYISY